MSARSRRWAAALAGRLPAGAGGVTVRVYDEDGRPAVLDPAGDRGRALADAALVMLRVAGDPGRRRSGAPAAARRP